MGSVWLADIPQTYRETRCLSLLRIIEILGHVGHGSLGLFGPALW